MALHQRRSWPWSRSSAARNPPAVSQPKSCAASAEVNHSPMLVGEVRARHLHAQRQLRIVGRKPVAFLIHQIVEKAPGQAGRLTQIVSLLSVSCCERGLRGRAIQPEKQQRRNHPQHQERRRWARAGASDKERASAPPTSPRSSASAAAWSRRAGALALRRIGGLPFQQTAPAD